MKELIAMAEKNTLNNTDLEQTSGGMQVMVSRGFTPTGDNVYVDGVLISRREYEKNGTMGTTMLGSIEVDEKMIPQLFNVEVIK